MTQDQLNALTLAIAAFKPTQLTRWQSALAMVQLWQAMRSAPVTPQGGGPGIPPHPTT